MQKRLKSPMPILLGALVFLIYALLISMTRIIDIGVAFGLAAASYFALGIVFPGKLIDLPQEESIGPSGDERADEIIRRGRAYIRRLGELDNLIADEGVSRQINHLIEISRQIFDFISRNPAHHRKINTFMEYYYPTALKFLESFSELSGRVVRGGNIAATLAKLSESLASIEIAFEHQLDNLYSDKALDIKTDIAVLDNIIEREGMK